MLLPTRARAVILWTACACASWSTTPGCGSDATEPTPSPGLDDASPPDASGSLDVDAAEAPGEPLLVANISASAKSSPEIEPHIAQDGAGTLVAVWIAASSTLGKTIGYVVSHDRGAHWTEPVLIVAPGGRQSTDPTVASDGAGSFYLSWYGSGGSGGDRIFAAKLARGGDVFGAPVEVAAADAGYPILDKPWLIVDGRDEPVVTWVATNGSPSQVMIARSRDGGATFQATTVATGGSRRLPYLCTDRGAGAAAPLYLVNVLMGGTPEQIELRTSADGATWSAPSVIARDAVHQDPTCAAMGSRVWVGYAQGTAGVSTTITPEAESIRVLASENAAVSFAAAARVSGGPAAARYLLPDLLVAPPGGLQVAYFQGVVDQPATLERAVSADNGATWQTSTVAPSGVFVSDRQSLRRLGDYIGQASDARFTYAVYGDNSGYCGTSQTEHCTHIAFARLPLR